MNKRSHFVNRDLIAEALDHGASRATTKHYASSVGAAVIATLFAAQAQAQQPQNLALGAISLDTALLTVQSERTKLLEQQMIQQMKAIQARHDQIAQLNSTLAELTVQRNKLLSSGLAGQAKAKQLDMQIVGLKQQLDQLAGTEKMNLEGLKKTTGAPNEVTELLKQLQEKREQELTKTKEKQDQTTELLKKMQERMSPEKSPAKTEEKTVKTVQEEVQPYEQRLKELREKVKQLTSDPAQKKQREKKQLELVELEKALQQPKQKEEVTTEMQPQEVKTPAKILPNTEEKKGPVPTLTQTKEKTEPAIKQAQEVTPTPDELKLQQQIKKVREKLTELKNDPEQKKQLEQKLLELTKLQQQKLPEKTGPGTTLTKTEEKKGPATTTEMTREGLKELKAPPPNKLVGPFPMLPGDDMVAPLDAKTLKPVALPSTGSTLVPGGDISREDILAMLDKAGAQLVTPFDTQSLQMEQVLALFQIPGGNVGSAGATAAGFAGLQTGALTMAALDVARQVAAASSSGDVGVGGPTPSFPYITAGSALPFSSWPTAMVAGYVGRVSGTLNSGASIGGSINIVVNFTQLQSAGNPGAPGNITFDNGAGGMTFNLVRVGNFVGEGASGTYNGQAVTGYIMNGQFYGPQAQEIGGQWSMQNAGATVTAGGNFAAKQ